MLIFRKTFASIVRGMLIPVLLLIVQWGVAGCEGGVQSSGVSHPPVKGSQTLTQVHLPTRLNTNRPVLAFFYMWYTPSTWCLCHMSDLPTTRYDSSDDATYDDTKVPGRKFTYVVKRNNGATYRTSWAAATASNPEWITITTFNEWFEGAMIEPGVHYGNQYLDLTKQFATQWHG